MSIDDAIERLCGQGRLEPYKVEPSQPTGHPPRCLYLATEILPCLDGLQGATGRYPDECGKAKHWWLVESLLMDFVEGAHMKVRHPELIEDPPGQPTYLAQLQRASGDPWGIWEFRPPTPIRIFGGFYRKDRFVGLTFREHEGLDYRAAMNECASIWDKLFGTGTRLKEGIIPNAYLSTASIVPSR